MIGAKLLHIRFNKVDGFISVYDGNRYLVLFGSQKMWCYLWQDQMFYKSKNCITYAASHNYVRIKIDSYNALPLEKTLTLHNVIVLLKSVFNKVQINYYYNIYLEKCFYQLAKK